MQQQDPGTSIFIKYLVFGMLLLLPLFSVAQEEQKDCLNSLDDAKEFFRKGKLERVPEALEGCINTYKVKEQKIEAYRLLTEAYIFLQKDSLADASYLSILKLSPAYSVDTTSNSPDLVYLSNRFRTRPVVSLEFFGGVNNTMPSVEQQFGTDNLNNPDEKYNLLVPGFHGGFNAAFSINDWVEFVLGGRAAFRNFGYVDSLRTSTITGPAYSSLDLRENHTWLDIPLAVRVTIPNLGKVTPYLSLGVGYHLLLDVTLSNLSRVAGDGFATRESFSLNSSSSPDLRVTQNFSATGGVGLKYAVGINYIFLDLGYSYFTGNMVETNNRYTNETLLYDFAYVDNDYRISSVSVQVGFAKSIYKPRLKKKPDYQGYSKKSPRKQPPNTGSKFKESSKNVIPPSLPETPDNTSLPEKQVPEAPVMPPTVEPIQDKVPQDMPVLTPDTKVAPVQPEVKKDNPVIDLLKVEGDLLKNETEREIKRDLRSQKNKILNQIRKARRDLRNRAKKKITAPIDNN